MVKTTDSLTFKFAIILLIFMLVTLAVSGLGMYHNQMRAYERQCAESIRAVGDYLEHLMVADGEDFITYRAQYMERFAALDIPLDFTDWRPARDEFRRLLAERHPGRALGADLGFAELDREVQDAWLVWRHEWWMLTFEQARDAFGLPYTYFLVPKEEIYHVVYMIDGERSERNARGGKVGAEGQEGIPGTGLLYLGDEYPNPFEANRIEWTTWLTGERQDDLQEWDNAWGNTYTAYTPLVIGGKKLGLIGTEIEVARVNKGILLTTLRLVLVTGVVFLLGTVVLLCMLSHLWISKIALLEAKVHTYRETMDPAVAEQIDACAFGHNEISSLAEQFSAMIAYLDDYIRTLSITTDQLNVAQEEADAMNRLAQHDALTGIRNKTAYDKEVLRLEAAIAAGGARFGIAMVDLNFLKRLNDTYGHEKGNVAIIQLCQLICAVFKHSPVFRIGGDEFVVVLERGDYDGMDGLVDSFNGELARRAAEPGLDEWLRISAAIGFARYDAATDTCVNDVFKRADMAMYAHKKEMKAVRVD